MTETVSSGCIWMDAAPDEAAVALLARELGITRWLAGVLTERGLASPEDAHAWLHPRLKDLGDPLALPDMDHAVPRTLAALAAGERITIFGDYDVDGLTSATAVASLLRHAGARVQVFLPHRLEEGYGLSIEALHRCIEETRPNLIITVDCGTGSVAAVAEAMKAGIDVIVTDHHSIGEQIAPACAVVNPRRSPDERLHVLAGVGVAFKFCHALLKVARRAEPPPSWAHFDPKGLLDLVALGTVADLVPLTHENRILVAYGLLALNRTQRVGLRALIDVAGVSSRIDTYEVGYLLGPRLNASGRLGTALTSLRLLMTDDPQEALACAHELDDANRQRQQVEKAMVEDLLSRVETRMAVDNVFALVEADPDWHPGVVGIAASRIMQKFGRPCIVIGKDDQDRAKGSCRSVRDFNMVEALDGCREFLVKFGGHAMAAGLEIAWDQIDAFRQRFERVAREKLSAHDFTPRLAISGWLEPRELNETILPWLDRLRPFGVGNPEPLWGCRGLKVSGPPREVGKGHLKARFAGDGANVEAIGFGLYERALPDGALDAAFHLRLDTYRGVEKLVMHLKDFRASRPVAEDASAF
jgi:single-stranded-DNA-specific exonuclease